MVVNESAMPFYSAGDQSVLSGQAGSSNRVLGSNMTSGVRLVEDMQDCGQSGRQWLETALQTYLHAVRHSSLKPSSRRIYISRLLQFARFLIENADRLPDSRDQVLQASVVAFLSQIEATASSQATTRNYASTLSNFAIWLQEKLDLSDFDVDHIVAGERRGLSGQDEERFLEVAAWGRSNRDRVLAYLFLRTGIRLSECVAMKTSDLKADYGQLVLVIPAHGRVRERRVVLDGEAYNAMRDWLHERQAKIDRPSNYLFPAPDGGPLSPRAIDNVVRRIGWQARLSVCVRTLRDTYYLKTTK